MPCGIIGKIVNNQWLLQAQDKRNLKYFLPHLAILATSPLNRKSFENTKSIVIYWSGSARIILVIIFMSAVIMKMLASGYYSLVNTVYRISYDQISFPTVNLIACHCFPGLKRILPIFICRSWPMNAGHETIIAYRWYSLNEKTNAIDNARRNKIIMNLSFEDGDIKSNL